MALASRANCVGRAYNYHNLAMPLTVTDVGKVSHSVGCFAFALTFWI